MTRRLSFFDMAQNVQSTLSNFLRVRGVPEERLLRMENDHVSTAEACGSLLNLPLFAPQIALFKLWVHSYAYNKVGVG